MTDAGSAFGAAVASYPPALNLKQHRFANNIAAGAVVALLTRVVAATDVIYGGMFSCGADLTSSAPPQYSGCGIRLHGGTSLLDFWLSALGFMATTTTHSEYGQSCPLVLPSGGFAMGSYFTVGETVTLFLDASASSFTTSGSGVLWANW